MLELICAPELPQELALSKLNFQKATSLPAAVIVRIAVKSRNEPGSLARITQVIADNDGNIDNLRMLRRGSDFTEMLIELEVWDLAHLNDIDTRGWIASDLHVHANPSFDSAVSLEDRVASLVAEGIGFATPTEHNVVGDYGPGVAALPASLSGALSWVPAVEVTTDPRDTPLGHFNVYPYPPAPGTANGAPPPWRRRGVAGASAISRRSWRRRPTWSPTPGRRCSASSSRNQGCRSSICASAWVVSSAAAPVSRLAIVLRCRADGCQPRPMPGMAATALLQRG